MTKILFVCLGNICRSPAAEAVMKSLIEKAGLEERFYIDSAGILSYHRGELADPRMRYHASKRGYDLTHRSRPVCLDDFLDFDMIIAMDESNVEDLKERAPSIETMAKIRKLTDYCTKHPEATYVPDPYYGGSSGFEYVLDLLEDACTALLSDAL